MRITGGRAINYREMKRMYDLNGPEKTCRHLREALINKDLAPADFSIREVAEATAGLEWVKALDPRSGNGLVLTEAFGGVDVTAFSNITGQIAFSSIMQAYTSEEFVLTRKIPDVPTRLDGEKIPGVARMGDKAAVVQPGMPYEHFGFGEDFIETPNTTKRGFIVPVTKEAIFFDRTNLIISRAAEVGEWLGMNKEERLIDMFTGATNNYKRKGTDQNTYSSTGADTGTDGEWINLMTSELIDWTDVDEAEQLFVDMLDPNTSKPILITGKDVMVMPGYMHAANRVFNASLIEYLPGGATPVATKTVAANPLSGYSVDQSRLINRQLVINEVAADAAAAKKYWWIGDFAKTFQYMENWPITVVQAPPNSDAEFNQDIVVRYKASERGAASVKDPRYTVMSTGAG